MAAKVMRARVKLKKAQVWYKEIYDRRVKHRNAKIKVVDYVWLYSQDKKGKDKLGGRT